MGKELFCFIRLSSFFILYSSSFLRMLIDTHAHVNFKPFKDDGHDVLKESLANDIWVFNVGSQSTTSKRAVEYAEQYEKGVYAIVGLHPSHVIGDYISEIETDGKQLPFKPRAEEFDYDSYKELAMHDTVVGIGECGLDFYRWDEYPIDEKAAKKRQMEVLDAHIALAKEVGKPLMFHTRSSMPEMLDFLEARKDAVQTFGGQMHCFQGSVDDARRCFDLNIKISFTGLITFAHDWDELIKWAPLGQIMVETDCPYLTPVPDRGKRNTPMHVTYVAQRIAEIKAMTFDDVAEQTTQNVFDHYHLKQA